SSTSSRIATRAPKAAKPRAIPLPMPAPAPVTTAVRPVRSAWLGSMTLLGGVADEHALARLETVAEAVRKALPPFRVLPRVVGQQLLLDRGVVDDGAGRVEGRAVGLADRDVGAGASRLDAPDAPRRGPRADVDRAAVVEEPDLGGLPELTRLPLALHVHVHAAAERLVDVGRE